MPFDRDHITVASRIMVPAYVVLSLVFASGYILDPEGRLGRAPSTTFQRHVMPLPVWGLILLAVAALMIVAIGTRKRYVFAYATCVAAMTWLLWGGAIAASIFLTDDTSYLAPVLPWFVTTCCVATVASLVKRET